MGRMGKSRLILQTLVGWLAAPLIAPLYFLAIFCAGYRIRGVRKLRKACLQKFREHPGPWIVCANHLTMVDSAILTYGMLSLFRHFTNYRRVPWNLPEETNFNKRNILLACLCYLCRCIPVHRGGSRAGVRTVVNKCSYVLEQGESLMIFPEGGRSRTGRVDTEGFSYGVGKFVQEFPECKVMCFYLRGDGQHTYGNFPRFRERFTMNMEVLVPEKTDSSGLRAQKFYAEQIIQKLARMEEEYFAHWKRRRQFERSGSGRQEREYPLSLPDLHAE